ncbi:hypothetical protein KG088_17655 [Halomonas sp. TRM85114]|uniref:hypothetical protein n=1 Tax=Halomonas jincaotanensis TaxID=2810616 RepID=UPI001BD2E4A1|nr:hypothetical protein [Halomonas jincaotanensis]MBS9405436.1 hypothetical protein [Halomonas jincaotanensis]
MREQLAEFATDKSLASEEEQLKRWEVKPQYRGLRHFMSHNQDVRRPYSLQPLLALSQDPVSRKHGDKAVPIEEALRTSDVVALMDAASLTDSNETFPTDFSALLADLIDDLRTETPTIQDNVAFTVAQLDERILDKDKRRILGHAVRRAAVSEHMRWRLGPAKLHALTQYAENEELRALGRALIDDITADATNVRLPSREVPSLREGRELTQDAADLVVTLMQHVELPAQSQSAFGQWLLNRTIKFGRHSDQLPLSWLEDKLADHEGMLLPLIRDDYPRIIVNEYKKEQPEDLGLSILINRLNAVFTLFFEQGTQTRAKLWEYLKDFAALRQPRLVTLAFSTFAKWHGDTDVDAAHSVFTAMGARLVLHEEDVEAWPLDDEQALRDIFTDLTESLVSFDDDGIEHMVQLAKEWSKSTERAYSASKLYTVLGEVDSAEWTALSQDWAKRLFTDLPATCQQVLLLAANSKNASDELHTTLASTIALLRGPTPLDDHKIEALSRLLTTLDKSSLEASPFAEQLEQFVEDTANLVTQNPGDHLV